MLIYGLDIELGDQRPVTRDVRHVPVAMSQQAGVPPTVGALTLESAFARLDAAGQFSILVRRDPLAVVVTAAAALTSVELIHPVSTFVAAVIARWSGRSAFHAASVKVGGRAWVLLGPPFGGKSTLAAAFHERGHDVLADDLTILDGQDVFAGPRSYDLRSASAARFGLPDGSARAGPGGSRWRGALGEVPLVSPLAGFIDLRWSEGGDPEVVPMSAHERLVALSSNDALLSGPAAPTSFIDYAALPFYRLTRPRGWEHLGTTIDAVEAIDT